ncbi:MAG: DEAD/DEAH box helicase family protein, partial [Methanobrevibacter sp.]|nr:DEAD/DEAH box helicase family protein [Methanobrevibacter sp.]
MKEFKLKSPYKPLGDQPQAIESLVNGIKKGYHEQTLLGVTGSGKTYTMANIIEKVQKPTLIISHNKTLAAQLYEEFKVFFPENAVEYFVSYYDYYQPEAYVPRTDTFIDKEASINEEIDIMRHSATQSLLSRDDVIVVSSVSCIYGIGSPEDYGEFAFSIAVGDIYDRSDILRKLIFMQYERNDIAFERGQFRVRGDVIEINPVHGTPPIRIELFGDEIDAISLIDPVTGKKEEPLQRYMIFPAKHFVVGADRMDQAL